MKVVVYGPPGCGKSQQSESLKAQFGCSSIVDEWDGQSPLPDGALALTHLAPPFAVAVDRAVAFEHVA
jgi:hypothetical protein